MLKEIWTITLRNSSLVDVKAEGCKLEDGNLVFFNCLTLVASFAAGYWTEVRLQPKETPNA